MRQKRAGWFCGSRNKKVGWVCGGAILLAALIFAPLHRGLSPILTPVNLPSALVASNSYAPGQRGIPWYIQSGQWRADMRSLGALLRYLTDSEEMAQTNRTVAGADDA